MTREPISGISVIEHKVTELDLTSAVHWTMESLCEQRKNAGDSTHRLLLALYLDAIDRDNFRVERGWKRAPLLTSKETEKLTTLLREAFAEVGLP